MSGEAPVLMVIGGAVVGRVVIAATGMVAAGMVGGGAGVGMAAGPFGMIIGGLVGLALYGLARAFDDQTTPLTIDVTQAGTCHHCGNTVYQVPDGRVVDPEGSDICTTGEEHDPK